MPKSRRDSAIVGLVIALQITVPTVALSTSEPPTRFGFQMYSAQGWTTVKIFNSQGQPIKFDQPAYVPGLLRPDINWTRGLPEYLCRHVTGAALVVVEQPEHRRQLTC